MHAEPAPNGNKIFSFSGDAEDEGDDPAVDLFAEASKLDAAGGQEAGDGEGEGEDEDEAEPEDDFNAAWEVLDLARAIYEKRMDGDDEVRLKAADTFIALGDVSLETGACFLLSPLHTASENPFLFLFFSLCVLPASSCTSGPAPKRKNKPL